MTHDRLIALASPLRQMLETPKAHGARRNGTTLPGSGAGEGSEISADSRSWTRSAIADHAALHLAFDEAVIRIIQVFELDLAADELAQFVSAVHEHVDEHG